MRVRLGERYMSFRKYEKYKESGIEWLGEVPAHWVVTQIKYVAQINPSKSELKTIPLDTPVTFLPMESIGETGRLDMRNSKPLSEVISAGYTYLVENDVIIAKITPCFENGKGAIATGLLNGIAFATTEVVPFRCFKINNQYLYFLLSSSPFRKIAEGSMYGAGGQKRISETFFANYKCCIPPTNEEQKQIVAFIDKETTKIDTLIDKQEQLITLLQEKRQAVISHAVTRGLNPNVKIKDSGIEWLGGVPEHWEVKKLKHILLQKKDSIKVGPFGSQLTTRDMEGVDIKVINQRNVIDNDFDFGDNFINHEKYIELRAFTIFPGDILITTRGTIGRTAIFPNNNGTSILHPCLMRLQVDEKYWLKELIALIIQGSGYFLEQLKFLSNATTIDVIYSENLKNVTIALPPTYEEQKRIIAFLDQETTKIDTLIEKCETAIKLLKERRTVLISAAVTGKIDVRDAV